MKTSLKILIVIMAFVAVCSGCQLDIANSILSIVSIGALVICLILLTISENATKE